MLKILCPLLFILSSSCKNKSVEITRLVKTDTLPAILISGLGDDAQENILNSVAKKFGFRFLRVGGCVVSKNLSDSMRQHNDKMYKMLEAKYGKGFRNRFYDKVGLLTDIQYRIERVLNQDVYVAAVNEAFGKEAYAMQYEIDPDIKKSIVIIHAYSWEDVDGDVRKQYYYTTSIDTLKDKRFK
jgi:hypothetical protein